MRILIFGDSITQGYVDPTGGWADKLKQLVLADDVWNAVFCLGISGDKTADILNRLDAEVQARTKRWDAKERTIIIFAIGTNDSYTKHPDGSMQVSDEQFAQNVAQLTQKALLYAADVVWMPILPVNEALTTPCAHAPICYTNKRIDVFNETIKSNCTGAVHYANFDTLPVAKDLPDGLHPGTSAHTYIAEQAYKFIQQLRN